MSDIALDATGDLLITDGALSLVDGADAVTQLLSQSYKFFAGEWFLDVDLGIPYFEKVFTKNPDPVVLDTIFKRVALNTPGILSLDSFGFQFDSKMRSLTIRLRATSTDGPVEFNSGELGP
ncbi:MAG: baseplate sheath protein [Mu-like cryoconite phage AB09]|nr:MAG: baseplate sheath protein [Mu-like cryoconite phage AB09]